MWIVVFNDERGKRIDVLGRTPSKMILFASEEAARHHAESCEGIADMEIWIAETSIDGSAIVVDLVQDHLEIIGETHYESRPLSEARLWILDESLKSYEYALFEAQKKQAE